MGVRAESDSIWPNLIMAGAAKAGTTSLHAWLSSHPDVFMSKKKEPGFFIHGYGYSDLEQYLSLFQAGRGKQIIGEASTAYLAAPESPVWIKGNLDRPKIIISLRNPIDRAFSLYNWMVMVGLEWMPTFEQALAVEEERRRSHRFRWKSPEWFRNYEYFNSGLYCSQVGRYLEIFDKQDIKIVVFDDLVASPETVYSQVCDFLGITKASLTSYKKKNVSRRPRSVFAQYLLRGLKKAGYRHPGMGRAIRRRYIDKMMRLNLRLGQRPRLLQETREALSKKYERDIDCLSDLIERDFSRWLR